MTTEQNKASYRSFIEEAWNKGNLAVIKELASPDLVAHFLPPGTPPGSEGMMKWIASSRSAFPDVRVTVDDLVAEGDRIVARWTMTGTHRGPFPNHVKNLVPGTGRRISGEGIDIWRYDANGKWIECWSNFDRLGMMQQLGVIPTSEPSPS